MKCWNSAFNAQGSRVIIVVVQVRAVKMYVAVMEVRTVKIYVAINNGGAQEKRKEGMRFSLPPTKIDGTLDWVPVISFWNFLFPVMRLIPYYA